MAKTNGKATNKNASDPAGEKKCFFISEFGADEETRLERKQTLKHLVKKVLEPLGYQVQRADDIDDLGQITHQIIERLLDDDLVVADLTGLNPNVFYELAVRHAARRPVITLMTFGESIPFDLKDVRTVFYDLHDPDKLEDAQEELEQKARAIDENPSDVRNPITVARDVALLQQSEDPDAQAAGAVLSAVSELRDEMRVLGRRTRASVKTQGTDSRFVSQRAVAEARLGELFGGTGQFTTEEVAEHCEAPRSWVHKQLEAMVEAKHLYIVDGKWSAIPF